MDYSNHVHCKFEPVAGANLTVLAWHPLEDGRLYVLGLGEASMA